MGRAGPGRAGWNGMGAAGIDMGERMGGVWAGPGRGRISASKPADTRALRRYSAHLPPLHLAPLRPRGPLSTRSPTFPDLRARARTHSHSQVQSPGPVPARSPIRPPTKAPPAPPLPLTILIGPCRRAPNRRHTGRRARTQARTSFPEKRAHAFAISPAARLRRPTASSTAMRPPNPQETLPVGHGRLDS